MRNERQRPEEKFEKILEAIREKADQASSKADKGEDTGAEMNAISAKKSELDGISDEIRAELESTERTLKEKGVPKEILDRHYRFSRNFEDNLQTLKANLADAEAAKTKADRKAKLEKVRLQLEKTQPKKHVLLDPNNLPFQNRKAKVAKTPRLKKEEFEKDFGKRGGIKTAYRQELDAYISQSVQKKHEPRIGRKDAQEAQEFIMLAYNDIASDVPLQLPRPSRGEGGGEGRFSFPDIAFFPNSELSTLTLAAVSTGDLPTADDLAETPEIQFTSDIIAKAAELGNNPVKIFNWIRNNIEYAPTYSSIQGADMCLQSKICNDMDTASLLIALLRASGISARYAYGTVDIPIEQAMNWVGGATDPKVVGNIFATNGVPVTLMKSSASVYKYARIEHVWVSAYIDYFPSRGAVHKQGDTWVPLDASFKQYTYTQGMDISSAVPFDAQKLLDQVHATATINLDGSVTNVNSTLIQQAIQDYQTKVQNYIQQANPNATVGDVIGKKDIFQQNYPILIGTLPYKTVQVGSEFAKVPDTLRATMSLNIPDAMGDAGLTYSTSLPQIAGKKITLSFSPATTNDEKFIESLLPQPHADGTPIDPSELPSSFPAYLINLKPELRIDGLVVATGASGIMGSEQLFTISLNEPGLGMDKIDNIVASGEYYSIGIDIGRISADRLNKLKLKLEATKAQLAAQNYAGISKDDIVGDLLFTTIATYFYVLDANDEKISAMQGLIRYRVPSVGMYSVHLDVQDVFGIPVSATSKGMMMDVDRTMQATFTKDGSMEKVKQYMFASGSASSALEHMLPEQMYSTADNAVQGISAIKALQIANNQGISIFHVSQSNVDAVLPILQVDNDVKNDIRNAINAGKEVVVSKSNMTLSGWTGCGYVVTDPVTGAGVYMISGGQSGGKIIGYIGAIMWEIALGFPPGDAKDILADYGQTLWFLGANIVQANSVPKCHQTFSTCDHACMNLLNPYWLSTEAGALIAALNIAEMKFWALATVESIGEVAALQAFIATPVAVASGVLGSWLVGTWLGCKLVCAADHCSYQ